MVQNLGNMRLNLQTDEKDPLMESVLCVLGIIICHKPVFLTVTVYDVMQVF